MKKRLSLLILAGWTLFACLDIGKSLWSSYQTYPYLWGVDTETKKHFLDGDLYGIAKVCQRKISPAEPLFFYNDSPIPFFKEQDRQKLSYLLYPRRVYWDKKDVREPIRYVLIYHTRDIVVPGFESWVKFQEDIQLLKQKGRP